MGGTWSHRGRGSHPDRALRRPCRAVAPPGTAPIAGDDPETAPARRIRADRALFRAARTGLPRCLWAARRRGRDCARAGTRARGQNRRDRRRHRFPARPPCRSRRAQGPARQPLRSRCKRGGSTRLSARSVLPGIGELLLRSGAPVVPAYAVGAFAALPRERRVPRLHRVAVAFGDPIPVAALRAAGAGRSDEERIASTLRERVADLASGSEAPVKAAGALP